MRVATRVKGRKESEERWVRLSLLVSGVDCQRFDPLLVLSYNWSTM